MKKLMLSLTAITVLSLLFTACGQDEQPAEEPIAQPEPQIEAKPFTLLEEAADLPRNPLTNLPLAEQASLEQRVFVVSIDNFEDARPQSGISEADIMYEVPAEGGISRLLGLYYQALPEKIGPVRSARPYMVDIARGWQGVFVHCGGSEDALSYLSRGTVNSINEMAYSSYFWRDNQRYMPHNLYTSSPELYRYLDDREYQSGQTVPAFTFAASDWQPPETAEAAEIISITYPYNDNLYVYNQTTQLYARTIDEEPHIDANNNRQIQAANIIVQKVNSRTLDNVGRLGIDMVGSGEALFFSRGLMQVGSWECASLDEATYFYDAAGNPWQLNSGQTWIQVTDAPVEISYTTTAQLEAELAAENQNTETEE